MSTKKKAEVISQEEVIENVAGQPEQVDTGLMDVDPNLLQFNPESYCRDEVDVDLVDDLIVAFKNGVDPQTVIINEKKEILDGVSTWYAVKRLGRKLVEVRYYTGDDDDSPLLAGARINQCHGNRLRGPELKRVCEEMYRRQEGVECTKIAALLRINRVTAQKHLQDAKDTFERKLENLVVAIKTEHPKFSCAKISKDVISELKHASCGEAKVREILKRHNSKSSKKIVTDFSEDEGDQGSSTESKKGKSAGTGKGTSGRKNNKKGDVIPFPPPSPPNPVNVQASKAIEQMQKDPRPVGFEVKNKPMPGIDKDINRYSDHYLFVFNVQTLSEERQAYVKRVLDECEEQLREAPSFVEEVELPTDHLPEALVN